MLAITWCPTSTGVARLCTMRCTVKLSTKVLRLKEAGVLAWKCFGEVNAPQSQRGINGSVQKMRAHKIAQKAGWPPMVQTMWSCPRPPEAGEMWRDQ